METASQPVEAVSVRSGIIQYPAAVSAAFIAIVCLGVMLTLWTGSVSFITDGMFMPGTSHLPSRIWGSWPMEVSINNPTAPQSQVHSLRVMNVPGAMASGALSSAVGGNRLPRIRSIPTGPSDAGSMAGVWHSLDSASGSDVFIITGTQLQFEPSGFELEPDQASETSQEIEELTVSNNLQEE